MDRVRIFLLLPEQKVCHKISSTLSFWGLETMSILVKKGLITNAVRCFHSSYGIIVWPKSKVENVKSWALAYPLVLVVTQQLNVRNTRLGSLYGVDQRSLNKLSSSCPKLKSQNPNLKVSIFHEHKKYQKSYLNMLEWEMIKRNSKLSWTHHVF